MLPSMALIQMVQSDLVLLRVDIHLRPPVRAFIILMAVILDGVRNAILGRMGRRTVRAEDG